MKGRGAARTGGGVFVDDDQRPRMVLQSRERPQMVHAFLCKQAPRGAADPTSAPAPAPPPPPPQGGLPSARALTDGLAEREALALAGDDDDDLARVEDGADADGERHARDGGDVVVEEARVGEDGVVCERLDARARREGGACVKR